MLEAVKSLPYGDYAECGVWQGYTAKFIYAAKVPSAKFYLFDSFCGHDEPSQFDDATHHPKGRYSDVYQPGYFRKAMPGCEIMQAFLKLPITELFQNMENKKFRFVHIDVDHYVPTKVACEYFKDRMVNGGIIRFDDYGHSECPGATLAVNQIFGRDNILSGDYRWIKEN